MSDLGREGGENRGMMMGNDDDVEVWYGLIRVEK